MLRKAFVWLCAVSAALLLAGCGPSAAPPGSSSAGSTSPAPSAQTSQPPSSTGTGIPSGPASGQDVPQLQVDTSTGPVAESLPWILTGVDKERNRVYLSAQVRACNEPVRVRYQETAASIVITLVGNVVPADTVCPLHVTIQTGYVQLPDAIGSRSIEHAPVTPGQGQ